MKIEPGVKFPFEQNIKNTRAEVFISNNADLTITHGLGYLPATVWSGRVEVLHVRARTPSIVTIRAKLLSTFVTQDMTDWSNILEVEDSTLFFEGDTVVINGLSAAITGVYGDTLFLNSQVRVPKYSIVRLESTLLDVIFY